MEFFINRSYFLNKITNVSHAISPNSPNPSYSGILIFLHPYMIHLTAQDSTMAIVTEIHPGELNQLRIESTGHMIVDAKYLIEIIRHMGGKNIHVMTVGDNMIQVSDENSKFNLFTLELERFALPDIKRPENEIKISLKNIRTTVDQIAYATSEKDARTMLMGVNFRSDGKRIITAATDSYRMALNYIDGEFSQNFNVTVPVRALQEAARIFKNDDDIIQIFVNKRKIQFVSDRTLIQSTLYDGTFPDIAAVIPKNFKSMMELDASMIIPVIERGILFKDDGVAELRMNLSEKGIQIYSGASTIGNADQQVYEVFYQGEELRMAVNGEYLLQAIKALKTLGKVRIDFTGVITPFKVSDPENKDMTMLVVPMRSSY